MDIKRILFIVNPISGTSGKRMVLKLIKDKLDKNRFAYDIAYTKYRGHASDLARGAANQGVDIVCAIGGDGTVNEVARSLVHTDTALAIIPSGSGNGLARHLHIPIEVGKAIDIINKCEIKRIDYGIINDLPFFCTCGVGFDAFISMKFAQAGKRGPITYMENVLKNGFTYNPQTYDVTVYGEEEEKQTYKAFLISCANASQYGNNAYIAPQASVCDGLLDVTIMEPFKVIDAPSILIQLFNGTIDQNSCIRTFTCKRMVIHRSEGGAVHYDGDPVELGKELDVQIIPGGLLCVSTSDEGVNSTVENIQGMISEQFNQMFLRSEELLQATVRNTQRIGRLDVEITRRLAKGRRKKGDE